jgi:hypothetical protein
MQVSHDTAIKGCGVSRRAFHGGAKRARASWISRNAVEGEGHGCAFVARDERPAAIAAKQAARPSIS